MQKYVKNNAPRNPLGWDRERIGTYAESIGEMARIYTPTGRANVETLVESIGGAVSTDHGYDYENRMLTVYGPGVFEVVVPGHTSTVHDRFVLARAVGHYYLHYLEGNERPIEQSKQALIGANQSDMMGVEAMLFGLSLLMPKAHFVREFLELDGDNQRLHNHFAVGTTLVGARAKMLEPDIANITS